MRSAYEPMVQLYDHLPTGSLNDLLNVGGLGKVCCPPGENEQLQLFITILKDEWTQLDAQLASEAQVAATNFTTREIFQNGDHPIKNVLTKSMVQRKKINESANRLDV